MHRVDTQPLRHQHRPVLRHHAPRLGAARGESFRHHAPAAVRDEAHAAAHGADDRRRLGPVGTHQRSRAGRLEGQSHRGPVLPEQRPRLPDLRHCRRVLRSPHPHDRHLLSRLIAALSNIDPEVGKY